MLFLYYVMEIGSARRIIAARHPEALDLPVIEEDRPMTREEAKFIRDMGIETSGEFHIYQEGGGVRRLLRIYNAYAQAQVNPFILVGPEASLYPGVQPRLFEWLTVRGNWVAETCSEMFALRFERNNGAGARAFVIDSRHASAADQLAAAADGLPTCTEIKAGDGFWAERDFFGDRMKELL